MLPVEFKKYFWDADFEGLDAQKHSRYIIQRILEYGDKESIRWLIKNYKKSLIKQTLLSRRGFSKKSANYWALVFDLPKDKVLCLKKSYQKMQKSHWSY